MIKTENFVDAMKKAGINFVVGVPDSLLKNLCSNITTTYQKKNHIIAANEGSAVGLAIGHYLAKSTPAMVYMQNSGLGNAINPLVSLADPMVCSIPMLLVIGWRGEILEDGSQLSDEPQHKKQGLITIDQLEILNIPYIVIDKDTINIDDVVSESVSKSKEISAPVAIVVRKDTFKKFSVTTKKIHKYPLNREEVIELIISNIKKNVPIVCTTGVASRELFELRKRKIYSGSYDFLTVGGMGHASSIATGIANSLPDKRVICIDGDGSAIMHLGALAINADSINLVHFIINNEVHDSVGAQPTKGEFLDFSNLASTLGYLNTFEVHTKDELIKILNNLDSIKGSTLISIKVNAGFRSNLTRPDRNPVENKKDFMNFLKK